VPSRQGFDLFFGYNCQRQAHTYYPMHLWRNEERVLLNNEMVAPHTPLEEGADPHDPASYARFRLTDYAPELMHQTALDFIDENQNAPFFLYYASPIPHMPLQAPQRWVEYYTEKLGTEAPYTGDRYFPNLTPRATYAAMISYLDEQVGDLVAKLDELGLRENTLILFTSDNGPTYSGGADAPFFDSAKPFQTLNGRIKGTVYEGGIRVPMIARWPGKIQPGTVSDHLSAFYDFLPTFVELSGAETPTSTDGISLLPALLGKSQTAHDFLYWEFPSYNGQQAVRMGRWKGIRKDIFDGNLTVELYDLESDIEEQFDVSAQHPDIVSQIEAIMIREHVPASIERFKIAQLGDE
jgi:arylsulfatase